jgi:glycosyltransferase involved in cell wall biosynthesis
MTCKDVNPKISIITPSFNQGEYLEDTILSVFNEKYPNLEYIVIDGGSTDNSVEVIKKYDDKIDYWCSEKDEGQSHALIKGFERSTGEILCWLNSDDMLYPGALEEVVKNMSLDQPCWIIGHSQQVNKDGKYRYNTFYAPVVDSLTFFQFKFRGIVQPSVFWNRKMVDQIGGLEKKYHYIMDMDYFYRMSKISYPVMLDCVLSRFRTHSDAKTSKDANLLDKEYTDWLFRELVDCKENHEITKEVLADYILLQRCYRTLQVHPVISRFVKFWKKYVNNRVFVSKDYP